MGRFLLLLVVAVVGLPTASWAGEIRIVLPATTWVTEQGPDLVVSGTAEPGNNGSPTARVSALVQLGATCAPKAPASARSDPRAADLAFLDSESAMGPFSFSRPLIVSGPGTVCAWLTEDTAQTVTVASATLAPRYRVPLMPSGYPFFVSRPVGRGGTLTSFVSKSHRFTRFTAVCLDRRNGRAGTHDQQRFTLRRSVTPNPLTGTFAASGAAKPDNSRNYDSPAPRPYRGRATLRVTGELYVSDQHNVEVRASYRISGRGLRCAVTKVR